MNKSPKERADELYHHGIKGQKWGVRRFQNDDGTLTSEGKKRYGVLDELPEKSEHQRRWEDDHGINPNRPNKTKTRHPTPPQSPILDRLYNKRVSELESKTPKWIKLVERILDPDYGKIEG